MRWVEPQPAVRHQATGWVTSCLQAPGWHWTQVHLSLYLWPSLIMSSKIWKEALSTLRSTWALGLKALGRALSGRTDMVTGRGPPPLDEEPSRWLSVNLLGAWLWHLPPGMALFLSLAPREETVGSPAFWQLGLRALLLEAEWGTPKKKAFQQVNLGFRCLRVIHYKLDTFCHAKHSYLMYRFAWSDFLSYFQWSVPVVFVLNEGGWVPSWLVQAGPRPQGATLPSNS